jgi:hypothetical protein
MQDTVDRVNARDHEHVTALTFLAPLYSAPWYFSASLTQLVWLLQGQSAHNRGGTTAAPASPASHTSYASHASDASSAGV